MSSNDSNATTMSDYAHPTLAEYYLNLTPFITLSIFLASLLLILNCSIFSTTVSRLRRRLRKDWLAPTTFLCAMYPVMSLAALATILVPKAWFVCHTVMHLCFTVAAIAFQALCFRYVHSDLNLMKEADGEGIGINTPPCCCCCSCLPVMLPSKTKFSLLRCMVRQMVLVQGSIMVVLNVVYYKEPELYGNMMIYFMPFVVTSILIGVWGLNITVRMVSKLHPEYGLMKKMFCVQLIILLGKLQYLLLDSQLDNLRLGGAFPINHTIYKQTLINLLILMEMVLVSFLVQHAYRIPTDTEEEQITY